MLLKFPHKMEYYTLVSFEVGTPTLVKLFPDCFLSSSVCVTVAGRGLWSVTRRTAQWGPEVGVRGKLPCERAGAVRPVGLCGDIPELQPAGSVVLRLERAVGCGRQGERSER